MAMSVETAANHTWRYDVRYPSKQYILKDKIFVQIESSGVIYVLAGAITGPTNTFPSQPTGFPLRPYGGG